MRKTITFVFILAAILAVAPAALAGGWATASFESLPENPGAGEGYSLEYTALQHGETPVDVGDSSVTLRNVDTGETIVFPARAGDAVGRYIVEIEYPAGGMWEMEVSLGEFAPQVVSPTEVSATTGGGVAWPLLAGAFAVVAIVLAIVRYSGSAGAPQPATH